MCPSHMSIAVACVSKSLGVNSLGDLLALPSPSLERLGLHAIERSHGKHIKRNQRAEPFASRADCDDRAQSSLSKNTEAIDKVSRINAKKLNFGFRTSIALCFHENSMRIPSLRAMR